MAGAALQGQDCPPIEAGNALQLEDRNILQYCSDPNCPKARGLRASASESPIYIAHDIGRHLA